MIHVHRVHALAMGLACLTPNIALSATLWEGDSDSSWFTLANWSNGVPSDGNIGTVTAGTPFAPTVDGNNVNSFVNQTGNTVTLSNGGVPVRFNDGTWTLSGGTIDLQDDLRINSGSANLVIDGGDLTDSGLANQLQIYSGAGSIQFLSGSVNLSSTNIVHREGLLLIDDAAFTANTYTFAFNGTNPEPQIRLSNGGTLNLSSFDYGANPATGYGQITFDGSASHLIAADWNGKAVELNFDFVSSSSGSTITVNSTNAFDATAWEAQYAAGKLTVDGSAPAGEFDTFFSVDGGTLTFIPEPGSMGLLAAGAALIGIRRRKVGA